MFGLGTVIAGISFGAGQQISQKEVDLTNSSNNTSTSEVQSTPQPINNNAAPTSPPSIIYLAPAPNQHNFIPTHPQTWEMPPTFPQFFHLQFTITTVQFW